MSGDRFFTVGVVGACGYVGRELVRWIGLHPRLKLSKVFSRTFAGTQYGDAVPAFKGFVDLEIQAIPEVFEELDILMLATPHGAAAGLIPKTEKIGTVVDLSRDHRHADGWAYGQPEWLSGNLKGAARISAPGCFATAISLACAPLVESKQLRGPVRVSAATGSTGSGASPKAATHHPDRFTNIKAYKILKHQHVPEISDFLGRIGTAPRIDFVPVSAPIDRGIFATVFADVSADFDLKEAFLDAYKDSPMIRIRDESPNLRALRGTALTDISVHQDGESAVILVAIDNLGKGAASQAIQALNISLGFPDSEGLLVPSCAS